VGSFILLAALQRIKHAAMRAPLIRRLDAALIAALKPVPDFDWNTGGLD